jgi:hypothetical protein
MWDSLDSKTVPICNVHRQHHELIESASAAEKTWNSADSIPAKESHVRELLRLEKHADHAEG